MSTIIKAEDVRVGDRIKVTRTYDEGNHVRTSEFDVDRVDEGYAYRKNSGIGAWLSPAPEEYSVTIELIRREIPEPKGLGAVVRLKNGVEYVRADRSKEPWLRVTDYTYDPDNAWAFWTDIQDEVVEVLSEGYTAPALAEAEPLAE